MLMRAKSGNVKSLAQWYDLMGCSNKSLHGHVMGNVLQSSIDKVVVVLCYSVLSQTRQHTAWLPCLQTRDIALTASRLT